MFWVYVLENPRGKFYIGQTENIGSASRITIEPIALRAT
jgi:predicted GIY-YIG superfamily endonuclease